MVLIYSNISNLIKLKQNEMVKHIHVDEKGKETRFEDLTNEQLRNLINFHKKQSKEGIHVISNHGKTAYYAYDKTALNILKHDLYLEEFKRRGFEDFIIKTESIGAKKLLLDLLKYHKLDYKVIEV